VEARLKKILVATEAALLLFLQWWNNSRVPVPSYAARKEKLCSEMDALLKDHPETRAESLVLLTADSLARSTTTGDTIVNDVKYAGVGGVPLG
jgi:hypothetical protein